MHACIHTYTHEHIHTHIHAYMHHIHTYTLEMKQRKCLVFVYLSAWFDWLLPSLLCMFALLDCLSWLIWCLPSLACCLCLLCLLASLFVCLIWLLWLLPWFDWLLPCLLALLAYLLIWFNGPPKAWLGASFLMIVPSCWMIAWGSESGPTELMILWSRVGPVSNGPGFGQVAPKLGQLLVMLDRFIQT